MLNKRGDTIVEVMIVLAILGMALSIAYATANRSLLNTRQAQESAEANELAQAQVEQIRLLAAIPTPTGTQNVFTGTFCTYANGAVYNVDSSDSAAHCTPPGLPGGTIKDTWGGAPDDDFTVLIRWPDVLGEGNDTVTLSYRVHTP